MLGKNLMKSPVIFLLSAVLYTSSFAAVKSNDERALGEKLFKTKGCTMCHKKNSSSIGPSIVSIEEVYSGKEKQLYRFLKGKGKAKVNPKKAHVMSAQFTKLKALNDTKIRAIARYIVTISDREF